MTTRRLHIGALHATPGWETLNTLPLPGIEHVCDARDLSRFPDNTFETLYASHVLEHFDYKNELNAVFAEWYRVLVPGGQLFVSVPDLDTICRLYCDRERFDIHDRWLFVRMLMGGHADQHDYHLSALNEEFLSYYLSEAGFSQFQRVSEFGLFDDTSAMRHKGEPISLNLIATKPEHTGRQRHVSFSITKNGITYPFEYLLDTTLPTQGNLAAHICNGSLYEPEVSLVLMHVLQEGDGVIDIGANSGFYAVMAGQLVGRKGAVYAFEPEQGNLITLRQNIRLNHLDNVEVIAAAVGSEDTEVDLYINRDNDGGHALWNPGAHSFNRLSCESIVLQKTSMVRLDTFFNGKENECPKIKLIKIDAEGYEHHALMGAVTTIRQHTIPFILAEINRLALQQSGTSERTFRLFMHHLGYTAYLAEINETEQSLQFMEMPTSFIPSPENRETVYNLTFTLPGELERYGFKVIDSL
jgi:FkbM family methyltransferase